MSAAFVRNRWRRRGQSIHMCEARRFTRHWWGQIGGFMRDAEGRLPDRSRDIGRGPDDRLGRGRASARPAAGAELPPGPIFGTRFALQAIRQAMRSGGVELDLSGRDLTVLPAELGQLTGLQRLNL